MASQCGMWILVPQPGVKPVTLAMEAAHLNHWPTQEKTGFVTSLKITGQVFMNVGQLGLVWGSSWLKPVCIFEYLTVNSLYHLAVAGSIWSGWLGRCPFAAPSLLHAASLTSKLHTGQEDGLPWRRRMIFHQGYAVFPLLEPPNKVLDYALSTQE